MVWQRGKTLAVTIYRLAGEGRLARDFGLTDQLRRSAVSIPSNIAEGDERGSDRDSIRFLNIAKGSLAELITQLEIAKDVGYLTPSQLAPIFQETEPVGKMLGSLIKARSGSLRKAVAVGTFALVLTAFFLFGRFL